MIYLTKFGEGFEEMSDRAIVDPRSATRPLGQAGIYLGPKFLAAVDREFPVDVLDVRADCMN